MSASPSSTLWNTPWVVLPIARTAREMDCSCRSSCATTFRLEGRNLQRSHAFLGRIQLDSTNQLPRRAPSIASSDFEQTSAFHFDYEASEFKRVSCGCL